MQKERCFFLSLLRENHLILWVLVQSELRGTTVSRQLCTVTSYSLILVLPLTNQVTSDKLFNPLNLFPL